MAVLKTPQPKPLPEPWRLLTIACWATLSWSAIECVDLVVTRAVHFAAGRQWPLFLAAHFAVGLAACLLQMLVLEVGSHAASMVLRLMGMGSSARAVAERATQFALHGLIWTGAAFTGLHYGRALLLWPGLIILLLLSALGPRPLPWRRREAVARPALAMLGTFLLLLAIHLFNRQWNAKFYFPIHVAATLFAITVALHGASYAWRAAGARSLIATDTRSGGMLAVSSLAAVLAILLVQASNDVRHVLFNRAFDAKGLLYVARKLRGAGFGDAQAREPEPLAAAPSLPRRKMVDRFLLVTIDALRADHLPIYGYSRPTAPVLSRFASGAVVFDWAWSVAPETSIAMHAIFAENDQGPQLNRVLAQGGIPRRAALDGIFKGRLSPTWLAAFDSMVSIPGSDDIRLAEAAAREIEQGRFNGFMWVHLFGPHQPYLRHNSSHFGDTDLDIYDGEIVETDRALGRILDALDRQGLADRTAVVIVGDHGEEMGEHGGSAHGWDIYNELLHVPLVIRVPQIPPRRISSHVTQRDLPLTIVDLLGLRGPATGVDRSLLPLLQGSPDAHRVVMTGPISSFRVGALMSSSWKLGYCLFNDSYALFDLTSDPGEQLNLFEARPDVAARLQGLLRARLAGAGLP